MANWLLLYLIHSYCFFVPTPLRRYFEDIYTLNNLKSNVIVNILSSPKGVHYNTLIKTVHLRLYRPILFFILKVGGKLCPVLSRRFVRKTSRQFTVSLTQALTSGRNRIFLKTPKEINLWIEQLVKELKVFI